MVLCHFKLKAYKSIAFTRVYILIFAFVMFAFVCLIGTVFEPDARAVMFIVYVLVLPMLFVIPTHYTYGFMTTATIIFSIISLSIKNIEYAQMDVSHSITCLVIGIFMSHHILESRISLYALNEQLDVHNLELGEQLQEKEQQLLQSRISILFSQMQPLVENAVKHGVLKRKKGGTVSIATRSLDNCYEIIIKDDGMGFDPFKPQTDHDTHIGIENVRDRLWAMCKGTLTIESAIGKGTTSVIKIPKGEPKR